MYCKSGSSDDDEPGSYGKRKLSLDDPDSPPISSAKRKKEGYSGNLMTPGNFHQQHNVEDTLQLSGSSSEDDEQEVSRRPSLTSRVQALVKEAEQPKFENSKIQRMLDKMGHKKGEGLGKHSQGRVAPLELSTQRGRRGLGFSLKGLEAATLEWDFSQEVVSVEEEVSWLEEKDHCPLQNSDLHSWMKEGPKKLEIEDETEFCDPEVLEGVLNNKTIFDQLPDQDLRKARMRCNPFETIRGGIFLNRAAMKMANMDAVFQYMFTNPKDPNGRTMVGNKLLYFADVCAGPGGFSEYVLWRKGWEAKGFGFTLKCENDFRLSDFLVGTPESFETHYGVGGLEGDGDVTVSDNVREFTKYIMDRTEGQGVHFMMADGGFSVEGQENIQEILSKQLYLCQFLVALNIVRTDGHFVCKVFDLFTPFSAGLIYLLYRSFQKVSIHKPNTSRPANSERYVICKWKRDDCDDIRNYMFSINERLCQLKKTKQDVVEVVPLDVMKEDADFMDYLVESNNSLGYRQVVNLAKIAAFCRDINLVEVRQAELRTSCLSSWKVPDIPRKINNLKPNEKCDRLLGGNTVGWMTSPEKALDEKVLKECIKSSHDWRCYVVANRPEDNNLTFYLGLGQGKVYSLNPKSKGKPRWDLVSELKVELSPGTLILGETLQEHQGEGRSQKRVRALHIIDAFFLGNVDLRKTHLKERHALCTKFAEAMNRPLRIDLAPIRVKTIYRSLELKRIFRRLETRTMKSSSGIERLGYTLEEDSSKYIIPSGILFIRETKDPWLKTLMRRNLCWYNLIDHQVKDNIPMDSIADLKSCFESRLMWRWKEGLNKFECDDHGDESSILSDTLQNNVLLVHIEHCSGEYRPSNRQRPLPSSSSFGSSFSAKHSGF